MFPMCHIYFADKVINGNLSDFAILGSIYPDILISNILVRDTTHYNTRCLYEHFKSHKDKFMQEFCIGAITHGVDMKGLDYYSDESYMELNKGYCFNKGIEIKKDVIECCNIPESWGLWKAHNFIEMAFDLYLCQKNSWLMDSFKLAVNNNFTVKHISENLQDFYNIPAGTIEESFKKFIQYAQYKNIDEYSIIEKYALQLNRKHGIDGVDTSLGALTILKAVDIVANDIDNFINYTVFNMQKIVNTMS